MVTSVNTLIEVHHQDQKAAANLQTGTIIDMNKTLLEVIQQFQDQLKKTNPCNHTVPKKGRKSRNTLKYCYSQRACAHSSNECSVPKPG